MIRTVIKIALLRLAHSRIEIALTFVVPIAFFTIFALIFGDSSSDGPTRRTVIRVIDEDRTELSEFAVVQLSDSRLLKVLSEPKGTKPQIHADEIRRGEIDASVTIHRGFQSRIRESRLEDVKISVAVDSSNPTTSEIVTSLVRQAVMRTHGQWQSEAGRIRQRIGAILSGKEAENPGGPEPYELQIAVKDVLGEKKKNPVVAMYAAGIAVLFLLFSTTGAAGSLLEEEEAGTLERLLVSRLSLRQLLVGKWLFITGLGCLQVTVMFAWAWAVFSIELLDRLPAFAIMTFATAASAAGLAILLATLCRSRNQLNGIATIVILSMSALGGSMVPRYVMSEQLQQIGLITFNAWALDGYTKILWRDLPISQLWPQLTAITTATIVFLGLAGLFSRRWDRM